MRGAKGRNDYKILGTMLKNKDGVDMIIYRRFWQNSLGKLWQSMH